jgi:predicted Zn finger-like uncharacterized protein
MILQCPSCYARFAVPDALIPPEGRTVRCGKCASEWHTPGLELREQAPPAPAIDEVAPASEILAAAPAQDVTEAAPEEPATAAAAPRAQLPVVRRKAFPLWPFQAAAGVLAAAWLVIALYAYFPKGQFQPGIGAIYSALGVTDTRGLVFADVTMERENLGGRTRFILAGSIANHAAQARMIPTVRVALKDKDGKEVWSRKYAVEQTVKGGEVYPFRIEDVETAFAARATSIVLDIGNSFELVMR